MWTTPETLQTVETRKRWNRCQKEHWNTTTFVECLETSAVMYLSGFWSNKSEIKILDHSKRSSTYEREIKSKSWGGTKNGIFSQSNLGKTIRLWGNYHLIRKRKGKVIWGALEVLAWV